MRRDQDQVIDIPGFRLYEAAKSAAISDIRAV
jgi:hypothetical protein